MTVKLPDELVAAALVEQEQTSALELVVKVLDRRAKERERKRRYRSQKMNASRDVPRDNEGQTVLLGSATTYEKLVAILVKRRHSLGLTQLQLDDKAGYTDTYTSKLEAYQGRGGRTMGMMAMPTWLGALGVRLQVIRMDDKA